MRTSFPSPRVASGILAITVLAGGLAWSMADRLSEDPAGQRFVDALGQRLSIRELPCSGAPELPGRVRCAEVDVGAPVFRAAHDEAMALAARELPVLDVRLQDGVPPNQLAGLPGLDPVPEIPGLVHRLYLIADTRVGVWVEAKTGDEWTSRVYFTVEELAGPFPDYFLAEEK